MSETGTRERILHAAARLLADSGGAPVSTRAVCAAAGVGAPTLYHHFGDKEGLLDAVVAYGFEQYLAEKRARPSSGDPIEDLRRGWDSHVEFGVARPAFYTLMYGSGRHPEATEESYRMLLETTEAVARAGRLRVPVRAAADMIHSASVGVTLRLISQTEVAPDPDLSARTREAILAAISTDETEDRPSSLSAMAIALSAAVGGQPPRTLSPVETAMLREWLSRLAVE